MADFKNSYAQCPFYREAQGDRFRIKCEGVNDNTTIDLVFKGSKANYFESHCASEYSKCLIFKMLMGKYE